jgi:XTP/dITP diphosphohydrolase
VALADPQGNSVWVEGMCPGHITREGRGGDGFGYDPVFQPDASERTFAEMSLEEKNRISHRGRALAAAREAWGEMLAGNPASLI